MNSFERFAAASLKLALAGVIGAGAWWLCTSRPEIPKSEKPPAAATVAKVIKEDSLNTIVLTEEAAHRLGLSLASAENRRLQRTRLYGGEVTVPPGRAIVVAAPLGGLLQSAGRVLPATGEAVTKGQVLFQLQPLLTPEARTTLSASLVDADGLVKNAETQVDAAKIAYERARRLHKEGVGSQRNVDETQATFELATKTLAATVARQSMLSRAIGDFERGNESTLEIAAPQAGILRTVSALPGQNVPTGAPLFEVADLSTLWLRMAIPAGDLAEIDRKADAVVTRSGSQASHQMPAAHRVAAPPSANPLSNTIDLFYELPNDHGRFVPGERLTVSLQLEEETDSLVVPASAIVVDLYGGSWVYEATKERTYVRRRVVVRYITATDAVLADGLQAGTQVVAAGAIELFAAETGFSK